MLCHRAFQCGVECLKALYFLNPGFHRRGELEVFLGPSVDRFVPNCRSFLEAGHSHEYHLLPRGSYSVFSLDGQDGFLKERSIEFFLSLQCIFCRFQFDGGKLCLVLGLLGGGLRPNSVFFGLLSRSLDGRVMLQLPGDSDEALVHQELIVRYLLWPLKNIGYNRIAIFSCVKSRSYC